jgi:ABC-type enterobactin transport system permease subunit
MAVYLGVKLNKERLLLMLVAVRFTAASVAVGGSIDFICPTYTRRRENRIKPI